MSYPQVTMSYPYPDSWPKPDKLKPYTLASRISEQEKLDLFNRAITTRALALKLEVREAYLSHVFPGKAPTRTDTKKMLFSARREFRVLQAKKALEGGLSTRQVALSSRIPYRSLARTVKALKESQK